MANKRIQGRRPKGFHLSTDECEMLNQLLIQVSGVEKFKLNNNFTAHYARLLMEQEPELAGWFEVRG